MRRKYPSEAFPEWSIGSAHLRRTDPVYQVLGLVRYSQRPSMEHQMHKHVKAVTDYLRSGKTLDDFKTEHGIRGKTDGNHIILDYDMLEVDWNQPYGHVCRGLVLCAHTYDVLGFPLAKFWNAGESQAASINWNTAKVLEKLDGSMISRWWSPHLERFCYSTRYQLPGDLAVNRIGDSGMTWQDLIDRCLNDVVDQINQQAHETTVFEAMSPVNRVVVAHHNYKANLLARRNNRTLLEEDLSKHPLAPRMFSFTSLEETEQFANACKGVESEGCVVVDANFNRIKIKGADYVRLHRLKDSAAGSFKAAILTVRHGEMSEVTSYFPQYKVALAAIQLIVDRFIENHLAVYEEIKHIESQKDFAIELMDRQLGMPGLLFSTRAGKAATVKDALDQLDDAKYVKVFKPLVERAGVTMVNVEE